MNYFSSEQPVELLRLSSSAWKDTASFLRVSREHLPPQSVGDVTAYHSPFKAQLRVFEDGMRPILFASCCRWVAPRHLSLLHGGFVYNGTPCEVYLATSDNEPLEVPGKVEMVRHVSGRVHELIVTLDHELEVDSFARPPIQANSPAA